MKKGEKSLASNGTKYRTINTSIRNKWGKQKGMAQQSGAEIERIIVIDTVAEIHKTNKKNKRAHREAK